MNQLAIDIQHCTKIFRRKCAVHDLNLQIEPGKVYGLAGDNGAGKTTTIKMMLGLQRPTEGHLSIMGFSPAWETVRLKRMIGYVSENREMWQWMKIHEIIWFTKQFYLEWDDQLVESTRNDMNLDPEAKIKHLSRGERAKLALLLAIGHRPPLLILDEPSSGLDPIVRREILEQVVSLIQSEGRTVFFSSHLLDEVERVADDVGIMHNGRLLRNQSLTSLKESAKRIRVTWNGDIPEREQLSAVNWIEGSGREESYFSGEFEDGVLEQFRAYKPIDLQVEPMSLEEIFVETVRSARRGM
ncbi:MAG: ABC transporter ATP-binding protein [Candidatus Hinthialibacter antarcticus]|nr:ABC transporter ATP-binding protein [Candidatus Hinthialibacter antarcticus]